ncbi:SAM-dependent methyltransferase [Paenibacillus forsythiae]|uniref:SAM-dependent methyltransferase n=1 Tax=Paenibacillus forsythiae TaxID=365616 RepID=A0ABU3HDH8_9BACL|nr:class I SAM-dependent methyltransferase [Paenibacillus forsythiae]MDT3427725.1 SAM-dependent methyltransferase [Paenibacillus forsythiae]
MQSVTPQSYWNQVFGRIQDIGLENDSSWFQRYQPDLEALQGKQVLEIGCGNGSDTRVLAEHGYQVTATDFSEAALSIVRKKVPEAALVPHDTRQPFPFADKSFAAVIASLSLHYFDKDSMTRIIAEIGRMLRLGGLLLIRLNSVNNAEAAEQQPIERYYYTLDSCRELFTGWKERSLKETAEAYYGKPKVIIEGIFEHIQKVKSNRGAV